MAKRRLKGADWSTAANWEDDAGATGKPLDNDSAFIPDADTLNADVIMSADEGDVDLDLLDVHPLFARKFGTSTAPLACAADRMRIYGSSGFYFDCDDAPAAAPAHTTDLVEIQLPNANVESEFGTKAGAQLGDYDRFVINRGIVRLKATLKFTATSEVDVGYVGSPASDVRLNIANGAGTLSKLRIAGGLCEINNVCTDVWISAGRLIKDLAKLTNLFCLGGEVWYHHAAVSGDATRLIIASGGRVFLSRNAKFKTITTVEVYPGGYLEYDDSLVTITTLTDRGGTIRKVPYNG